MDISLDASPDHQTLKYEDWFASLDGHGLSHQPLPPQQANSARLFFCPEKSVALNVFKHIGDGEMAAAFELPNYKTGDVPYNIPTLMSWLSLAPDKNVQFGVSELLGSKTKNNDTCALQHQIYLQRREENRYEGTVKDPNHTCINSG
jgi:hypothetical protein